MKWWTRDGGRRGNVVDGRGPGVDRPSGWSRWPVSLAALVVLAPAAARASEEADSEAAPVTVASGHARTPTWRAGAGLGGSVVPLARGMVATTVVRGVVGFDYGAYSLRAVPTFQYEVNNQDYAAVKLYIGYLALDNVFRLTPNFAMSVAPLVGYGYSPDPTPGCYDVCVSGVGHGVTVGADVSPATFLFGATKAYEVGVHANIFAFSQNGQPNGWAGASLEFRWLFEVGGGGGRSDVGMR